MHLPSPTYAFTIPSVHDETELDCRLYLPRELSGSRCPPSRPIRGAIVAHPYTSLGGCYDDPVVSFIGGELLKAGCIVGTFNFRGAGGSPGRTSWTARPELADYVSFYGFMLHHLHILRRGSQLENQASPDDATQDENSGDRSGDRSSNVHLILGGYSYGSMIASHLPTVEVVADLFKTAVQGSAPYEILRTAEKVFASQTEISSARGQLSASTDPAHLASPGALDISRTRISYLLISPLLPPINLFLTMFSHLSLSVGAHTSAQGRHISCPKPADQLCAHQTLAIYGNDDTFTSASKLRKWSDNLSHVKDSKFQAAEFNGVGHFWRENGAESEARDAVKAWLCQID